MATIHDLLGYRNDAIECTYEVLGELDPELFERDMRASEYIEHCRERRLHKQLNHSFAFFVLVAAIALCYCASIS